MKSKIIINVSLAALCLSLNANAAGFYVGAEIGGQQHGQKFEFISDVKTAVPNVDKLHLQKSSFKGGALIGWGINYHNFYGGLEADFLAGRVNSQISHTNGDTNIKMKSNASGGIAARVGRCINSTLLYIRLGAEFRQFKYEVDANGLIDGPNAIKGKKTKSVAFAPGIGVEVPFSAHWAGRLDVRHALFNKKSIHRNNGASFLRQKDMKITTALVGITYNFKSHAAKN
ncbi:MAG: porin family protein [Alphaproteobacteria bacterium]|nr:porin family protein [Alphaproteobacteria bacterium]